MAKPFEVKISGADKVIANLKTTKTRTESALRETMRDASRDLLTRAKELTPVLTGDLTRSGRSVESGSLEESKFAVTFGTDHAVFAHEQISPAGPRNLGRLSREKQQRNRSPDGPVGGHYLSRPFNRLGATYVKGVQRETLRALAGKALRKLFRFRGRR